MKKDQFVYHMVPNRFEGDTLYPLNELKKIRPEIAAEHAKKYKNRQPLPEQRIPPLDCLWNDVLMFSPVHPAEIFQTFRDAGYDVENKPFFEIPLSLFEPEKTAVYLYAKQRAFGDFQKDPDDFVMLADVDFEALTILGDKLQRHIERSKQDGRNPVMFGNIPHILYHGAITLKDVKIVK